MIFKQLIILIIFLTEIRAQIQTENAYPLITAYLSHLNITFCTLFTCWSKNDNNQLSSKLNKINIRHRFLKSEEGLTEISTVTSYSYVIDTSCQIFDKDFFLQNLNDHIMRLSHPWLILSTKDMNHESFFKNIYLRMDSNVKIAIENDNNFDIFDIYNQGLQINGTPILTKFGSFVHSHLYLVPNFVFYNQRLNMTGIELRSGSVILVPKHEGTFEEYMEDSRHTEFDTMSKFHYPLFLLLEEVHQFSHTTTVRSKWFGNYQNGTDGGVGELLYKNIIDITSTGASQRPPRVDAYDYLMPSYHFRPCYIFRNPGTYDPLSNEFLKPFTSTVWYTTFLVAVLIAISLKIYHQIETKFSEIKAVYSWTAATLTTLSVFFQQDASSFPTGTSGRIAFLVLQLSSVLLYNYYTSSIISSLLRKPPDAFKTLDELGHSKLEIGIEDLPYTITWFEIMNDSDVQHIYTHKVYPKGAEKLNIYEPDEGIARVAKGGFAYHTQLDTGYPIIARTFDTDAICDITELHMIPQVEAGMMVQKKSQYRELFHVTLRKTKAAGLVHRISQIWEAKKPECLASITVTAVGINQVFIAFLMLFIGMTGSLFLLMVEIFWFRRKNFLLKY